MKKILIVGLLFLAGCAPSSNDSDGPNSKIFNKSKAEYESISGLYEGTLQTTTGLSIPIAINIGYDLVGNGRTSDGKEILNPELRVSYDQSNFTTCDPIGFTTQNYSGDHDLKGSGKAPTGQIFNVQAKVVDKVSVTGNLTSTNWYNGIIRLTYSSPAGMDPTAILARREKYYKSFVGDFDLAMKAIDKGPFPVLVSFYTRRIATGSSICAVLAAKVSSELDDNIKYDATVGIQSFADPIVTVENSNSRFTGTFDFVNGTWSGNGANFFNYTGDFTGKRR